jgi:hypothetical protein
MACRPRHQNGRVGAKGPRDRPSKRGRLVGRRRISLTHRVTPVLTGQGCYGEYLHRTGKEATARCRYCDAGVDSTQHTLEHCPAWAAPRLSFAVEIGYDFSPPAILEALLTSERVRKAIASFCELIMLGPWTRLHGAHEGQRDLRWGLKLGAALSSTRGPPSSPVGDPDGPRR